MKTIINKLFEVNTEGENKTHMTGYLKKQDWSKTPNYLLHVSKLKVIFSIF